MRTEPLLLIRSKQCGYIVGCTFSRAIVKIKQKLAHETLSKNCSASLGVFDSEEIKINKTTGMFGSVVEQCKSIAHKMRYSICHF